MGSMNRGRVATAIVVALLLGTGLLHVAYRLAAPSDHARILHAASDLGPVTVTVAEPLPGGLRTGDRIVSIEGKDLSSARRGPLDLGYPDVIGRDGLTYRVLRDGQPVDLTLARGPYPLFVTAATEWSNWILIGLFLGLAIMVVVRRPDDQAARWLLVAGAAMAGSTANFVFGLEATDLLAGPGPALAVAGSIGYGAMWPAMLGFALAFARPRRLLSGLWRLTLVLAAAALVLPTALAGSMAALDRPVIEWLAAAGSVGNLLALPTLVVVPAAFVLGLRDSADADHRRRIRLVGIAFGVTMLGGLVLVFLPYMAFGSPIIPWEASGLTGLPLPLALAWAVHRHEAFDLRLVVNRSLVYGGLTLAIVVVYVVGLTVAGAVLRERAGPLPSLLATGLVAVLVQPLRDRLQRLVNQLTYGDRDDPYRALTRLGRRLESSLSPEEVLDAVADTVASSLRLPASAIRVLEGGDDGSSPARDPASIIVPLVHAGRRVGSLHLERAEPLHPGERRLLDDLARQAAAAVDAVRLTRELQESRARLVSAREEERRRIRNELHEGIGQTLAAIALGLEAARGRLATGGPGAGEALARLRASTDLALADLRRVAAGLGAALSAAPAMPAVQPIGDPLLGDRVVAVAAPRSARPPSPAGPVGKGWTRGALGTLLAGLILIGGAVAVSAARLGLPTDGWALGPEAAGWYGPVRLVVDRPWLSDAAPVLARGDEIVAVDGRPADVVIGDAIAGRATSADAATVRYEVVRDGRRLQLDVPLRQPGPASLPGALGPWLIGSPGIPLMLVVGLVVMVRRPDSVPARLLYLFATGFVANGIVESIGGVSSRIADLLDSDSFWAHAWLANLQWPFLMFPMWLHLFLEFPARARILARHPRLVPALIYGLVPASIVAALIALRPAPMDGWTLLITAALVWNLVLVAAIVLRLGWLLFNARGASLAQMRWVAWGVIAVFGLGIGSLVLAAFGVISVATTMDIGRTSIVLMPLAIAVAIVRHHLFDIDVVLSRTLVYGLLTGAVVAIYVGVVWLAGDVVGLSGGAGGGDPRLSLLAAGVVAVLVEPLRARLQRAVNRLMYGERDEPYRVLARLAERLEAAFSPEAALPGALDTICLTLHLPYAAIELPIGDDVLMIERGPRPAQPVRLPLTFQGESLGDLLLGPRAPGEEFGAADRRLLDDLARQVGVAVHAARTRVELEQANIRLGAALGDERRRLRRDLHDDLGPALSGLALQLDAAERVAGSDPALARSFVDAAARATSSAIGEIRRIVADLRPPALDELGLAAAIRRHAAGLAVAGSTLDPGQDQGRAAAAGASGAHTPGGPDMTVEAPDRLPELPAAVEVAAFRIALEAMTNVVRHAGARRCTVRLSIADDLRVEVVDDGRGLRPAGGRSSGGLGLGSMRERAAELGGWFRVEPAAGGGTRILASLPLTGSGALP